MNPTARRSVELIPATPQRLWGAPAVVNFVLGGLGAGLYVAAALAARFQASPAVTVASALGPVLVLAGFAAVATEAGRPLRGLRVLARVRSSWMSRELVLGIAFAGLAALEFAAPARPPRIAAAAAAVALALAQGFIVRRARGVAAWDVGLVPLAFLFSALVSGTGLYLALEVVAGRPPGPGVLAGALLVVAAGLVVWLAYLGGSREDDFRRATATLRAGAAAVSIAGGGYALPFLLVAAALALPALAPAAALVAGVLMAAGQVQAKSALILRVAALRPITLISVKLRGSFS
jgi:DMSO reductase anchor subunit